jgi:hypothetical protein
MKLPPMSPPVSRNTSGFTSPPPTPAPRSSEFYSQSTGSTSSWSSSGPSSNASTPRTSTDELPTPKASKHARTHSKTSTDGFRRARTRTLSRVKKRYLVIRLDYVRVGTNHLSQRQASVRAYRAIHWQSLTQLPQISSLLKPSSPLKSDP